jgi:uncharacterized RDD family membrane protein YckC
MAVKAPVGKRVIAYIIDAVLIFLIIMVFGLGGMVVVWVLTAVLAALVGDIAMLMMFVGFIPYFLALGVAVLYWLLRDALNGGRSFGKKFMGLKVVKEGRAPGYVDSFLRNITLVIPLLNLIDLVLGLVAADGRRIGDKIANTQVVEA